MKTKFWPRKFSGTRGGLALVFFLITHALAAAPIPSNAEDAVATAISQNIDIAIARKQIEAARGGAVEARSGYLPSVVSSGYARQRQRQVDSRLRDDDYNANLRVVQNLYTGGATRGLNAIARLTVEKRICEYEAVVAHVAMEVRVAFYDMQLNRAKIRVREQSVGTYEEDLKTQQERLSAGLVGNLNVSRAEVALANEKPELIDARAQLQNSYLRLTELLGADSRAQPAETDFDSLGQLQYNRQNPDLNESLAHADVYRAEIRARLKDVEIEEQQLKVDESELRPHFEAFSGYEVYSERDPLVGPDFNHGYVVGLNGSWHIFDGFATRGRLQATRARRDAALLAVKAAKLSVASDVRSAFLDLQQSDRVLAAETKNVQSADESLELAKGNLGAGLGTQLDVLQAATDVTRTRTTRLSAIYLHNVALAKLARATGRDPQSLGFGEKFTREKATGKPIGDVATPPAKLSSAR